MALTMPLRVRSIGVIGLARREAPPEFRNLPAPSRDPSGQRLARPYAPVDVSFKLTPQGDNPPSVLTVTVDGGNVDDSELIRAARGLLAELFAEGARIAENWQAEGPQPLPINPVDA